MTDDDIRNTINRARIRAVGAAAAVGRLPAELPRTPERAFVASHLREAERLPESAVLSLREAHGLVGMRPLECIEHDHDRYEAVQIGNTRYTRVKEFPSE